jgi:hypothetical protein
MHGLVHASSAQVAPIVTVVITFVDAVFWHDRSTVRIRHHHLNFDLLDADEPLLEGRACTDEIEEVIEQILKKWQIGFVVRRSRYVRVRVYCYQMRVEVFIDCKVKGEELKVRILEFVDFFKLKGT